MDVSEPFGGLIPGAQGAVLGVLLRTGEPLTGRQVHALVRGDHSLWSVQEALKVVVELGAVRMRVVGRAHLYAVNADHVFVRALLPIVSPVSILRSVVADAVDSNVHAVLLFGSMARGEATRSSDIDLAVIAEPGWSGAPALRDAIRGRMGNDSDVLVLTVDEFDASAEPVLAHVRREGIAVFGRKPRGRRAA